MIHAKTTINSFKLEYDKQELFDTLSRKYHTFTQEEIITLYYTPKDKKFYLENINKKKDPSILFENSPVFEIIISPQKIDFKQEYHVILENIHQYITDNFFKQLYRVTLNANDNFRMWYALNRINEPCTNFSKSQWIDYLIQNNFSRGDLIIKLITQEFGMDIIHFLNLQKVNLSITDMVKSRDSSNQMIIKSNDNHLTTVNYNMYHYQNKYLILKKEKTLKELLHLEISKTTLSVYLLSYLSLLFTMCISLYIFIDSFTSANSFKFMVIVAAILIQSFFISKIQYDSITMLLLLLNKHIKNKSMQFIEKIILNIFPIIKYFGLFTDIDVDMFGLKDLRILLTNRLPFNSSSYHNCTL